MGVPAGGPAISTRRSATQVDEQREMGTAYVSTNVKPSLAEAPIVSQQIVRPANELQTADDSNSLCNIVEKNTNDPATKVGSDAGLAASQQ